MQTISNDDQALVQADTLQRAVKELIDNGYLTDDTIVLNGPIKDIYGKDWAEKIIKFNFDNLMAILEDSFEVQITIHAK